jgi:hypothetical protein
MEPTPEQSDKKNERASKNLKPFIYFFESSRNAGIETSVHRTSSKVLLLFDYRLFQP